MKKIDPVAMLAAPYGRSTIRAIRAPQPAPTSSGAHTRIADHARPMKIGPMSLVAPAVALLLCIPACPGGGGENPDSQTESAGGDSDSTGVGGSSTGEASTTAPTTGAGTTSDVMTSTPTTTTPATDSDTTLDPGTTTLDVTTGPDTSTDAVDETTGDDETTGEPCVATPETCNDLDDDCNGIVDDFDAGGDGFCDCLNIALFGPKGNKPASEFETWLEAQGTAVDRIQLDDTPLSPEIVGKYDIIILDLLVREYSPEEALVMQDWVADGGGLMAMSGHTGLKTDVTRPNTLLGGMGLAYTDSKGYFNGPVTQWADHPVSQDVTSVSFFGGLYIDVTEDGVGETTIVATLSQGPVAVAQERMAGKLFVWGDEWIEYDSEWQNIPQIKQLWVNILGYLSPVDFCSLPE